MAKFIPPIIQDNPDGWGPTDLPQKYKDMPYQPFSKGDRLGKVSKKLKIDINYTAAIEIGKAFTRLFWYIFSISSSIIKEFELILLVAIKIKDWK